MAGGGRRRACRETCALSFALSHQGREATPEAADQETGGRLPRRLGGAAARGGAPSGADGALQCAGGGARHQGAVDSRRRHSRSEEHASELQSLMRSSYAVFCLKKKKQAKHS